MLPRGAFGVARREPHPSETMYFASNPRVAGMATEDDQIALNPFSPNSAQGQRAVMNNEAARVHMRSNPEIRPQFGLSPEQQERFGSYGSPDDVRQTIAARQFSGDPSAGEASPDQVAFLNRLRKVMGE